MYGSGWYLKGEQKIPGVGAGKISRRLLGRSIKEGAPPRVTIKEGHMREGHLTAGEYFGRLSDRG